MTQDLRDFEVSEREWDRVNNEVNSRVLEAGFHNKFDDLFPFEVEHNHRFIVDFDQEKAQAYSFALSNSEADEIVAKNQNNDKLVYNRTNDEWRVLTPDEELLNSIRTDGDAEVMTFEHSDDEDEEQEESVYSHSTGSETPPASDFANSERSQASIESKWKWGIQDFTVAQKEWDDINAIIIALRSKIKKEEFHNALPYKLSKKDTKLNHSFCIFIDHDDNGNEVLQVAAISNAKSEGILGHGGKGKVKLMKTRQGVEYSYKSQPINEETDGSLRIAKQAGLVVGYNTRDRENKQSQWIGGRIVGDKEFLIMRRYRGDDLFNTINKIPDEERITLSFSLDAIDIMCKSSHLIGHSV